VVSHPLTRKLSVTGGKALLVESVDTSGLKLDPSLGTGSSPVVGTRVVTPSMGKLLLVMGSLLFFSLVEVRR
jgi:hypothetical protein